MHRVRAFTQALTGRWLAPAVAFLVAVVCVPGWAGVATSPRWAVVALSLYFVRWWCWPFIAVCLWKLELDQAAHWAFLSGALCWGWQCDERGLDDVIRWFCYGIAVSVAVGVGQQFFGFSPVPQLVSPAGLFLNKNFFGEAACLGFIAALSRKLWLPASIAALGVALAQTRAAWLAALIGSLLLASWRQRAWLLASASVAGCLLWWFGIDVGVTTLAQRSAIWTEAAQHLTWLGNGSYDYSTVLHREANLHNDWLQFLYELGAIGLVPVGVVLLAAAGDGAAGVVALLVLGTFGFPLHMPATGWFAAVVVGYSLRSVDVLGRTPARTRLAAA